MKHHNFQKIKTVTFLIFLISSTGASAEGQKDEVTLENHTSEKLAVSIAYFGEFFVHTGIKTGIEYTLTESRGHKLTGGIRIGYWYQYRISNNLFADVDIGYRYTFKSGLFLDLIAATGYNHIFPDGKIYRYDAGKISRAPNHGYGTFMPSFAAGVGYNFGYKKDKPGIQTYLRPVIFGQFPLNNTIVPNIALEAGITIPLIISAKNKTIKEVQL